MGGRRTINNNLSLENSRAERERERGKEETAGFFRRLYNFLRLTTR